jgi:rhodanese-related sulfurtransferase
MTKRSAHKKAGKRKASQLAKIPLWVWIVTAVILVSAAYLLLHKPQQPVTSLPATITASQAVTLRDQGAFILDVREPDEYAQFHIPGATLIPLGELANRVDEVPKDRNVIVVCRTGVRSAQGRTILLNAGFTQVTSLDGGMTQWQAQNLPVVSG